MWIDFVCVVFVSMCFGFHVLPCRAVSREAASYRSEDGADPGSSAVDTAGVSQPISLCSEGSSSQIKIHQGAVHGVTILSDPRGWSLSSPS